MAKSNKNSTRSNDTYHHGDLRAELVRAGRSLLDEPGSGDFSLRELARSLGVSPSAPYRHFADANALLAAIAAEGYQSAIALREADIGEVATALVQFGARHYPLWQLMVSLPSSASDALEAARTEFLAELVGIVERTAGERDPELAIRKAVAIWAEVVGMVQLRASGALALLDDALLPAVDAVAEVLVSRRRLGAADAPPPES